MIHQKTSYKIRTAQKKDTISCINLSKASWPQWWSKNEKWGKKHIINCIKEKQCFVVILNHEIIGYLIFGTLYNKIHLQDIFVKEGYRREGIATKLLYTVERFAQRRDFKEIMSDCDISNKKSISFHLHNGFKKCGYIKQNWDDEDSYVFSKQI